MSRPTISLCMIARNEESFIEGCLESVRGICHETIVVDTGSSDRTREIARAAGALVLETPWTDDFAAARNVGVERATGSHILVLDADERLGPGMGPGLIESARRREPAARLPALYNASTLDATPEEILDGTKLLNGPVFVPRLFRNLPEMRFERRVHETLTRGFNDLQAKGVGQSIAVGAALIHYGDVPTYREDHAKDERNERLLRMSLEDDPADGEIAGYLVVQLIKHGLVDEARRVGETASTPSSRGTTGGPRGTSRTTWSGSATPSASRRRRPATPATGLVTVQTAQRFTPDGHPNLDYVEGLCAFGAGDLDRAEACFREALACDGRNFSQPVLPFITNELPRIKLAGVALTRGFPEDALAVLPEPKGTWRFAVDLVRAEVELARGDASAAMEILSTFVDLPASRRTGTCSSTGR